MSQSQPSAAKPRVALFVTCLVDTMRPTIGFASVKLLEDAGCEVEVPTQTCCGQPAFNSGDMKNSRRLARQMIRAFEGYDYVVAPSGSCAGTIAKHYVEMFEEGTEWHTRAQRLGEKSYELVSFLTDVLKVDKVAASLEKTATYHDSCSGLRELGIKAQPRKLLSSVSGLKVKEMEISNDMVSKKTANITASGADMLLAGDLGCLMNMAGKLSREGKHVEVRHVAEVLADMTDTPAISAMEEEGISR